MIIKENGALNLSLYYTYLLLNKSSRHFYKKEKDFKKRVCHIYFNFLIVWD